MAKALLILFGGRSMPNMLTIINEKPELVAAIVSQDVAHQLPQLQDSVNEIFKKADEKPQMDLSYTVDAFKREDVYKKCLQAVTDYPDYDWIFNVTAATTIMSIGAYEAAKELSTQNKSIRCWYLNTARSNVISLIDNDEDDLTNEDRDKSIFRIDLSQYVAVYNCRLAAGSLEDKREDCQKWIPFADFLIQDTRYIDTLKTDILKLLYGEPGKPSKKGGPKKYSITSATSEACELMEVAYNLDLVDDFQKKGNDISWKLNYTQANFLDGPWLEAYVWNEAKKLVIEKSRLFSDCQWNQKLVDPKKPDDKENKNELDVTMLYNAQLLIAECKTGDDVFEPSTLYKLDSVANLLGGRFVGKMLVTSQPAPDGKDRNKQNSYEDFKNRADERGIVIVTRETLGNIGAIIEQQAKHPKHARI